MEPTVGIIMPAYKCEKCIIQCVESVIAQTYKKWFLIIQLDEDEGGTTDRSRDIIRDYQSKDKRIFCCIRGFKTCPSYGRNSGCIYALDKNSPYYSEYICLLDADDFWSTEKLEAQVSFMEHNKDIGYSWMGGIELHPNEVPYQDATQIHFTSSLMVRREILTEMENTYGYIFDDFLYQSDDRDFILRLNKMTTGKGIDGEFVYQTIHKNSLTNCWWKCLIAHTYISLKHGMYKNMITEIITCPLNIIINKVKKRVK